MHSPEKHSLIMNSNKDASKELHNPKTAEAYLGQKHHREKMIRYLTSCFPRINIVELHDTLKECMFQVDKALYILEKKAGFTVKIDFASWLEITNLYFKDAKSRSRSNTSQNATQNINNSEGESFKLAAKSVEGHKKISREEQILNIIEENQINVENAALMQLLAKPVVCLERLPLSTITSTHQNVKKKLNLSSSPQNKINKKVVSNIKTNKSPVKDKFKETSPKKRKIKLEDKIGQYKKRKTFADINEVNEEINSVLDNDILESLSSERIFKKVEDKLKSSDEIVTLPPVMMSVEETNNIDKKEPVCSRLNIKIKMQHTAGVKLLSVIDCHNLEEPHPQDNGGKSSHSGDDISESPPVDTNSVSESKIGEVHSKRKVPNADVSNETSETGNGQEFLKETLCSNNETEENTVNKNIGNGINCEEINLPTTYPETTPSFGATNLNTTKNTENANVTEGSEEGNSLITIQGISRLDDSVNLNPPEKAVVVNRDSRYNEGILATTAPNTLHSTDTVNSNFNQESASMNAVTHVNCTGGNTLVTGQESQQSGITIMANYTGAGTVKNNNSGHLPKTNQVPVTKVVSKTQPKPTPTSCPARMNFLLNVTLEQAVDILLPLIKCLLSVTESSNPQAFSKTLSMVSTSIKYYLSKVYIQSFNIHSFINIATSKMSLEDKRSDLDKRIVKELFNNLSITTNKPVKGSEFLVRFYAELKEMANDPKYALDPLALDDLINSNNDAQQVDDSLKNRFYDGHTYEPVDNVYLTNVTQVHKITKPKVSSRNNLKNRRSNRLPVSKNAISSHTSNNSPATHLLVSMSASKNNPSVLQSGSRQKKPVENNSAFLNNTLNPSVTSHSNGNSSNSISSIPMQSISTTTSISSLNSTQVYSVPRQMSNAQNVLTNINKVPVSSSPFPSLAYQKYPSKFMPHCLHKDQLNSNNRSKLMYPTAPSGSCSVNLGISNVSQNREMFSVSFISHSTGNGPSTSKVVVGYNVQNQFPSGYNTVTSNNNGIQSRGTLPTTPFPRPTSNALYFCPTSNTVSKSNTQKQLPSGYNMVTSNNSSIQSRGTFPTTPFPHPTSNALIFCPTSNTVSKSNTQKQLPFGYNTVTSNNNIIQDGGTFLAPSFPNSTSTVLPLPPASSTVTECNTQKQLPSGCNTVASNNNAVQGRETFTAPSFPNSTSNILSFPSTSSTVSNCNPQKQLPSGCNTVTNNTVQNRGTFLAPSFPNSTSNVLPFPPTSNAVSECNIQKHLPTGYITVTSNNTTVQGRGTFLAPSFPHSASNVLSFPTVANTVSKGNTQEQLPSGYNTVTSNNTVQGRGTFLSPSFPHSASNVLSFPSASNTVSKGNTQKQLLSGYNTVTSNNTVQGRGTFLAPYLPHSASNVLSFPSASNTVSKGNTQKQLPFGYNTATSNNTVQGRGTFLPPSFPHSSSKFLLFSPTSTTVSECNTQRQLPSGFNTVTSNNTVQSRGTFPSISQTSSYVSKFNVPNQPQQPSIDSAVIFKNNMTSVSSVLPLTNNGTKHFFHRELPGNNVSSLVPKDVPGHASVTSNQKRIALGNFRESGLTQDEVVTGNRRLFSQSHQSIQQMEPRNCVAVNSAGKGRSGKGEDDSLASLKSYEANMNLFLPNMNVNCPDSMEFIDLDYYYGNSNNK